jgi:hypothetical protein
MKKRKKKSQRNLRVSEKISVLRHEGEPQDKAVATALSMERAHRLKRGGKYIHKRRGRRKGSR